MRVIVDLASGDPGRRVDRGCAPVRGDGHGLGRAPVGLGRASVFVAFDAEVGHPLQIDPKASTLVPCPVAHTAVEKPHRS